MQSVLDRRRRCGCGHSLEETLSAPDVHDFIAKYKRARFGVWKNIRRKWQNLLRRVGVNIKRSAWKPLPVPRYKCLASLAASNSIYHTPLSFQICLNLRREEVEIRCRADSHAFTPQFWGSEKKNARLRTRVTNWWTTFVCIILKIQIHLVAKMVVDLRESRSTHCLTLSLWLMGFFSGYSPMCPRCSQVTNNIPQLLLRPRKRTCSNIETLYLNKFL